MLLHKTELILPKTNITGTDGGSNLTFPVFSNGILALTGVCIVDLPPAPLHSASSVSGAVEFASKSSRKKNH